MARLLSHPPALTPLCACCRAAWDAAAVTSQWAPHAGSGYCASRLEAGSPLQPVSTIRCLLARPLALGAASSSGYCGSRLEAVAAPCIPSAPLGAHPGMPACTPASSSESCYQQWLLRLEAGGWQRPASLEHYVTNTHPCSHLVSKALHGLSHRPGRLQGTAHRFVCRISRTRRCRAQQEDTRQASTNAALVTWEEPTLCVRQHCQWTTQPLWMYIPPYG